LKRREQLGQTLDRSWFEIRERTQSLLREVQLARSALSNWFNGIPDANDLCSELRDGYAVHRQAVDDQVVLRVKAFDDIENALRAKTDDPAATPQAPDWAMLEASLSVAPLRQAVEEHNKQADDHTIVKEGRYETVLSYIIGSRSEAFRNLEAQAKAAQAEAKAASDGADLAERTLATVRQQHSLIVRWATLTNDLARVYGKDHLSVGVTATASHTYAAVATPLLPT